MDRKGKNMIKNTQSLLTNNSKVCYYFSIEMNIIMILSGQISPEVWIKGN